MHPTNFAYPRVVAAVCIGGVAIVASGLFDHASAQTASVKQERRPFVLRGFKLPRSDNFGFLRLNTKTGETWFGAGSLKWEKSVDLEPIPEGDYDAVVVDSERDSATIRTDRAKGTTWFLFGKTWVKIAEP